jgi:SAM-dependent methyltransferase
MACLPPGHGPLRPWGLRKWTRDILTKMTPESDLVRYYSARALEYEKVYDKPERQDDLRLLHELIPKHLAGRHVLEVACGTGYWTRRIARRAASITGCDRSLEVLALARERQPPEHPATFLQGDAFALADVPGQFDAAFVGFWWSHMLRADLHRFLRGLHARLEPGSPVVIVDNRYVPGSSMAVTRTDASGNTYQRRTLENGEEHDVLKNFPTSSEIALAATGAGGAGVDVQELPYYWVATYRARVFPGSAAG